MSMPTIKKDKKQQWMVLHLFYTMGLIEIPWTRSQHFASALRTKPWPPLRHRRTARWLTQALWAAVSTFGELLHQVL